MYRKTNEQRVVLSFRLSVAERRMAEELMRLEGRNSLGEVIREAIRKAYEERMREAGHKREHSQDV